MKAAAAITASIDAGQFQLESPRSDRAEFYTRLDNSQQPSRHLYHLRRHTFFVAPFRLVYVECFAELQRNQHDSQPYDIEEPHFGPWNCDQFTRTRNLYGQLAGCSSSAAESERGDGPASERPANARCSCAECGSDKPSRAAGDNLAGRNHDSGAHHRMALE